MVTILGSIKATLSDKLGKLVMKKLKKGNYETNELILISDYENRKRGKRHRLSFRLTVYMTEKEFKQATGAK